MAAAFVRSVEQALNNGANNLTVNTTGASAIVVAIASNNAGSNSVSSVSYDGKAGTLVKAETSTYSEVEAELWLVTGFTQNASGTLTISVTKPGGIMIGLAVVVSEVANAYDSDSFIEEYSGTGDVTITSTADSLTSCIVIGVHVSDTSTLASSGASQTRIDSGTGTSFAYECDYKAGASPTQSMSFTRVGPVSMVLVTASFTALGATFSCPGIVG